MQVGLDYQITKFKGFNVDGSHFDGEIQVTQTYYDDRTQVDDGEFNVLLAYVYERAGLIWFPKVKVLQCQTGDTTGTVKVETDFDSEAAKMSKSGRKIKVTVTKNIVVKDCSDMTKDWQFFPFDHQEAYITIEPLDPSEVAFVDKTTSAGAGKIKSWSAKWPRQGTSVEVDK